MASLRDTTLLIFCGGNPQSEIELMMEKVKKAITIDTLEKATKASCFDRAVLCTNYPDLCIPEGFHDVWLVRTATKEFHFGTALRDLVIARNINKAFYIGGAAAPLITSDEIVRAVELLNKDYERNADTEVEGVVVTNNLHSSDMVGLTPTKGLNLINLPSMDNSLAYLLRHEAGYKVEKMEETVGTCFDVDTPTDVIVLGLHPRIGQAANHTIRQLGLDSTKLLMAKDILKTAFSDVVIWGRVGPSLLTWLNQFTRCRWRVFSEERGMKALGRVERQEVVSMLGFLLEEVGVYRFFSYMSKLCSLAFIDTRVLFAHMGLTPSAEDRFLSDLGLYQDIKDPFIKDFTKGAVEADIPVILGGHSLVSGGLRALVDALWCEWLDSKAEPNG